MRLLVPLAFVLLLAGCGSTARDAARPAPEPQARLVDLDTVLPVRAAFNADRGKPRLLVLLSPT